MLRNLTTSLSYLISLAAVPMPLPVKERYAGLIWRGLFPTLQRFRPLQKLALATGNIQQDLLGARDEREEAMAQLPDLPDQDVSLLFSGGADSTLCAYLLSQRFRVVHLISFKHMGHHDPEKTRINADNLRRVVGEDKIRHETIDIEDLVKRVYHHRYASSLVRHGFLAQNLCGACKLSMHAGAVAYNLEHDIRYTASGAHMEGAGVFIGQMKDVRNDLLQLLFARYGMRLMTPVFYIRDSEAQIFDLGITGKPETKFPKDNTTYQSWCNFSVLHNIFARGYYLQRHRPEDLSRASFAYAKERISVMEEFLDQKLRARG